MLSSKVTAAHVSEFDLIDRIRARSVLRDDVLLGIGDDAAIVHVPDGQALIVTTDTLNAGVHFPENCAASDIGWKALAVNLSDLAAMGSTPAWLSLALSMAEASVEWLDGFLDGFFDLANQHRCSLIGGDTTRGPLSICVTAHGLVPAGLALRRDGAKHHDDIWISGTLGDAAAGLAYLEMDRSPDMFLRNRLNRPTPQIALGLALRDVASSCIDLSDGLSSDLAHVLKASGNLGADIQLHSLPSSDALERTDFDFDQRMHLQLAGGDDYELCFTAAPTQREYVESLQLTLGLRLSRVGSVSTQAGIRYFSASDLWQLSRSGYQHFT